MKLRNLFWFATGASISYHLVKNRHEMKSDVQETGQLVKGIQENLALILFKNKKPISMNS